VNATTILNRLRSRLNSWRSAEAKKEELAKVDDEYHYLSVRQLMWRKFRRHRVAVLCGCVLIFLYFVIIFAGFFATYDPYDAVGNDSFHPPTRLRFYDSDAGTFFLRPFFYETVQERNPETFLLEIKEDRSIRHFLQFFVRGDRYSVLGLFDANVHLVGAERARVYLLGADKRGRDLLSRIIYGGRISMTVGLLGVSIMVLLGTTLGTLSGYYGGAIDSVMQRIIEVFRTFPQLALWMALAAAIPPEWPPTYVYIGIVVVMGMITWTQLAREVRGKVMSLKTLDFVHAAEASGASTWRIAFKHLIPNTLSHIIVTASLYIPITIIGESMLSFLGIGVVPPMISWGLMLREATNIEVLARYPWMLFPGLAILVVVIAFNFLGDGLRDMADPFAR